MGNFHEKKRILQWKIVDFGRSGEVVNFCPEVPKGTPLRLAYVPIAVF